MNDTNNNIRRRRAIRVAENQRRWQVIRRRQQLRRRQQHRLITVCRLWERRNVLFGHLLLINVAHYMIFFDNKPDTTNLINVINMKMTEVNWTWSKFNFCRPFTWMGNNYILLTDYLSLSLLGCVLPVPKYGTFTQVLQANLCKWSGSLTQLLLANKWDNLKRGPMSASKRRVSKHTYTDWQWKIA